MVHKSQSKKNSPQKKATILFLSAVCFTLFVTHVCASYYSLSETDFPSLNLSLESPDQEVQFIQKEYLLVITSQPLFTLLSLIEPGTFYLNRVPVWDTSSSDRKFAPLRC